jgi:hypothetical protein
MKNIMILFVAAMAFTAVGCKKKGGGGEAVAKMEEFAKKMCDCKDAKCAQGVSDEMTKWGQEETKKTGDKGEVKMSDEDQKKITASTEKMTKCMTTAMGAGMGGEGGSAAAGSAEGSAAGSAAAPAEGSAAGSAAAPAEGSAAGSAEKK